MLNHQHQYSLTLIQHEVNNSVIPQRGADGYINATALCHAGGRRWNDYSSSEKAKAFLRVMHARTGIPVVELIQIVTVAGVKAVWVHPKIAVNLAQWISPEFDYQVSEWVEEWVSGRGAPRAPAELPPHLNRYLKNDPNVPEGHFSILQETALGLFGPMHNLGFEIPKDWVPDISVGKLYCSWLRTKHGIDTNSLPTYGHDYLDGRPIVLAKAYPEWLIPDYRNWFRTEWLPAHGVQYFKKKDPSSLAFLDRLPALAARRSAPSLPR